VKVTADAARRFLVARHLLAPARSLDGGPDAVLEVFRRLGSVQFDPLAVAGRNHDLMLHARVADYDPGSEEQQTAALAEEFPYLAEAVAGQVAKVGYDFAAAFEYGLDLILDALEKRRETT
jgi:uncharacterized protein YcaQ